MKKFEGLLFCSDLDGTLFTDDKSLSEENRAAIEYFKSEGGLFTFITGRVPLTCGKICSMVNPNAPYGCVNGGGIYDHVENRFLWRIFLPDNVFELIRAVDTALPSVGIQVNTEDSVYFCKDSISLQRFRRVTGLPNNYRPLESVTDPILKIIFSHHEEEQLNAVKDLLNAHPLAEEFDFIRSEKSLYEILPKGASKGSLLLKMSEILKIDPKKTVAIGDYYNDVSMIKAAGFGIAVANAVDAAKAVADYVTVTNNESAIAKIIEGLDSGKIKLPI